MATLQQQIAKHFREVFFGGNWTCSNLKDTLKDITWQQAISKVESFNTIAVLTYHIGYFVDAALQVLENKPLNANDKYSFDHPPITSHEDWESMISTILSNAEKFANLVEELPENTFWEIFSNEKYGNYYRNINGIIEHTLYHLGQIALIKKMLL